MWTKWWRTAVLSAAAAAIVGPVASAQTGTRPPTDSLPLTTAQAPAPASVPMAYPQPVAPAMTPGGQPMYAQPPAGVYTQPGTCAEPAQPARFTPFMLGDFIGPVANMFSDVKIAEGESPRPTDRVFYHFNYYDNLDKHRFDDPALTIHNINLYQSVFGFEKTFFDKSVSVGLRVPFYTLDAQGKDVNVVDPATGAITIQHNPGMDDTEFGNVAAIAKAIMWEDKETGSLLSAGATISVPTASSRMINFGQSTLAFVQPYAGFIVQRGDLFAQGFISITMPVARAESIVMFNDLGVGYYLYRDSAGMLRGVAPTAEVHLAKPLRQADYLVNDNGDFDGLRLHDVVDFTVGATFEFAGGATMGLGVASPVTGPKPFDFEVLAQLNYRF